MSLLIRKRPAGLNVRRKGYQHTTKGKRKPKKLWFIERSIETRLTQSHLEKNIWYEHGSSAASFNEREYVRSKQMLLFLGQQLQYGDCCGATSIMKVHIECYNQWMVADLVPKKLVSWVGHLLPDVIDNSHWGICFHNKILLIAWTVQTFYVGSSSSLFDPLWMPGGLRALLLKPIKSYCRIRPPAVGLCLWRFTSRSGTSICTQSQKVKHRIQR